MARKETANQATARRMSQRPSQADYEALSEFRYLIRCFLQFSQNAARAVGLTPRQHQALLMENVNSFTVPAWGDN